MNPRILAKLRTDITVRRIAPARVCPALPLIAPIPRMISGIPKPSVMIRIRAIPPGKNFNNAPPAIRALIAGGALLKFFPGGIALILIITLGFGIPLIILGIGAIKGKAGQTLAGAILLTVMSVLSLANILGFILYVLSCVFMWIGWRQNIKVAAWRASQGG